MAVYFIETDNQKTKSLEILNNIEQSFLRKIDDTAHLLSSQIYVIEQSQCIQTALSQENISERKNKLLFCSQKFFSILEDMFLVTEINYFSDKQKYLLRINNSDDEFIGGYYDTIHQPDDSSLKQAKADGFVQTRAINTNELSYGIQLSHDTAEEQSKLRLVTSRIINSESLPPVYIEIKLDISLLLDSIENTENISLLTIIEKEKMQQDHIDNKVHQHSINFAELSGHTIIYGEDFLDISNSHELNELSQQLSNTQKQQIVNQIVLNGEYYSAGNFILLDEGGHNIGHIISLQNNTRDVQALNQLYSELIIIISILSLTLFFIFNRYLSQIDARLTTAYTALLDEIEENKKAHEQIKAQDKLIMVQSRHAAMGEMISMIAHQWRQPLSVIAMQANNILADLEFDELQAHTLNKEMNDILHQTQHLSKTIDDFREFFRPGKNKEECLAQDVMEECFTIIGKSLENNNIEILKNYQNDRLLLIYSRELLQVLVNIVKNAKDVLVEKKETDRQLSVEIFEKKLEKNQYLQISITDNAGGVKEELQHKIFEPYFSTKGVQSGTGLGLYMSKLIIEKHMNGKIAVHNINDGAQFTIQLPVDGH